MSAPAVREDLSRYALLSIVTALVTIALKMWAWRITGSVGLLSDAAESTVNVVAAVGAFVALKVVAKPADADHNFGHTKAEYFSAVGEGVMIVVAAAIILVSAAERLMHPRALESIGVGLLISAISGWCGMAFSLLLALRTGRWDLLVLGALVFGAFAYVFTGIFGWITVLLEDARWPGMWKTVLLFPLHLGIWWVLMLVALVYRNNTWHDIPHTVRLSLSEIEAEHHTGRLMPLNRPRRERPDPGPSQQE